MCCRHLAHPGVFHIFHRDGHPGVVFVLRIARIKRGFEPQIFHADAADATRPGVSFHPATAEFTFHRRCYRCVHRHEIAVNGFDDPIPKQIAAAGLPGQTPIAFSAAKLRHAQPVDPCLRAGTDDVDVIPGFQAAGVFEMKTGCADRNVIIGNLPGFIGVSCLVVFSNDANQCAAIRSRRDQHRSVPAHALAAQHDAGSIDQQTAGNFVPAFQQQHRTTNAVGIRWQTRHIINRLLNSRRVVAAQGCNHNPNWRVRDCPVSGRVTANGKIRNPIAVFVGVVNQAPVRAGGNDGRQFLGRGVERESEGERDGSSRREEAHSNCRWPTADSRFGQSFLPSPQSSDATSTSAATKY